ncbi:MAG: tetratricopeptide repeat protein [Proteobacteria bacterium]|nr:tetratricopeptide repeat protein [Pseudomonadota bacterium]
MLHFLLFACIKAGPAYDNTAHLPTAALSGVFSAQDTTKVYEEALARRHDGDYRGAIDRLTWLIENDAETPDRLYQLGITYELSGDYGTAISVYERLMQDEAHVLDGGFRRALCLESTGDWDAALKQYRKLPQAQGFDRHDRITLDLALGIAELSAGKEKKGRAMIEEALRASEGTDDVTWIQAKARYALADHALDSARELSLQGREKRVPARSRAERSPWPRPSHTSSRSSSSRSPSGSWRACSGSETASWSCARTCWPCPRPGTSIPSSGRSTSRRSRSGPRC